MLRSVARYFESSTLYIAFYSRNADPGKDLQLFRKIFVIDVYFSPTFLSLSPALLVTSRRRS